MSFQSNLNCFCWFSVNRNQFCNQILWLSLMESLLKEIYRWTMTRVLKMIKKEKNENIKAREDQHSFVDGNKSFDIWFGRKFVWLSHIINLWRHQINNIHDGDLNCKKYVLTNQRIFMNTFNCACAHTHTQAHSQLNKLIYH